jgi:hypothetical protein
VREFAVVSQIVKIFRGFLGSTGVSTQGLVVPRKFSTTQVFFA